MNIHHKISYIEMAANDLAAVKKFYSDAFGWTFTDYGSEYTAFTDGSLDGGFAKGPAAAGGPLVILYSEDLEKTEVAIQDAGGRIEKPIFDFPGGRRFHFSDPAGNQLAVWSDA